jgi:hypothetical protein
MSRRAHQRKRERQRKRFAQRPKPTAKPRFNTGEAFEYLARPATTRALLEAIEQQRP